MRTGGAPGTRVGPNVKHHTRGCSGSRAMPRHTNVVVWVPISGGGEPSSVPTARKAAAHEAPASSAAAKAAMTVSQNRRAIADSELGSFAEGIALQPRPHNRNP